MQSSARDLLSTTIIVTFLSSFAEDASAHPHCSGYSFKRHWAKRTSSMAASERDGVLRTHDYECTGRHYERGDHGEKYVGEHPREV